MSAAKGQEVSVHCSYKYFGALHLLLHCDAMVAATNILVRCTYCGNVMPWLQLQIFWCSAPFAAM
jgi:hypothetical protein